MEIVFNFLKNVELNIASDLEIRPCTCSNTFRGQKRFKKGQLQGRLKQLNLEQSPGYNTR